MKQVCTSRLYLFWSPFLPRLLNRRLPPLPLWFLKVSQKFSPLYTSNSSCYKCFCRAKVVDAWTSLLSLFVPRHSRNLYSVSWRLLPHVFNMCTTPIPTSSILVFLQCVFVSASFRLLLYSRCLMQQWTTLISL